MFNKKKKSSIFKIKNINYKYGFKTNIKNDQIKKGINKKIIIKISKKKKEPNWILKLRLKAFNIWKKMKEPKWFNGKYDKINFNKYIYYSAPKIRNNKKIKKTLKKLNILNKKNKIAIDTIFDSISIKTTYKKKLLKLGIIFCSLNEAIKKYKNILKKYIFKVVPINDNFFSTLNASVFSDGTFIYIPKNTKCPINLSSYFRINAKKLGQFERTIIILEKNSYLNYIEGCSAPIRKNNQLHAAVVEIFLSDYSEIKYSTIQNWYTGNFKKEGGVLNFVTKRAICKGKNSKITWVQIETGSAITWKYPSSILIGNNSISNFYSLSFTKFNQQSDTGTKVIHIGKNTKSTIFSKNIAIDKSKNTYRGLVKIEKKSNNSKNFTKCNSLIIGKKSSTYAIPSIKVKNKLSNIEHEASISYIKENQIFFLLQRGIDKNNALSMIINGFCEDILNMLPIEHALEIKENLFKN